MVSFNQILPELYVGSCPEDFEDIRGLTNSCGITGVLNLQTDEDFRAWGLDWPSLEENYRSLSLEVKRVPMRDFDYDDQRKILPNAVRALASLLASGHTIYLHCNAGVGRSPLVAMAYLYWCRDLSLWEAIRHVEARRPCSPYDDLLEVSRQDLLDNDEVQKEISYRASQLSKQGRNDLDALERYRADAERDTLKRLLGVSESKSLSS